LSSFLLLFQRWFRLRIGTLPATRCTPATTGGAACSCCRTTIKFNSQTKLDRCTRNSTGRGRFSTHFCSKTGRDKRRPCTAGAVRLWRRMKPLSSLTVTARSKCLTTLSAFLTDNTRRSNSAGVSPPVNQSRRSSGAAPKTSPAAPQLFRARSNHGDRWRSRHPGFQRRRHSLYQRRRLYQDRRQRGKEITTSARLNSTTTALAAHAAGRKSGILTGSLQSGFVSNWAPAPSSRRTPAW